MEFNFMSFFWYGLFIGAVVAFAAGVVVGAVVF